MFTNDDNYPYLEEINEGVLRYFPRTDEATSPRVLDVGCGQGLLGGEIAQRGYEVWGIEQSVFAADRAEGRVGHVIQADLTDESAVRKELGECRFDNIVFSDVLEHVYDPLTVLSSYLEYLEPSGRLLISLPNVANWQTRLGLLCGRFKYQDTGVLDRTHIRFFTFKTAAEMVQRAGLDVGRVDQTPLMVRAVLPLAKRLLAPSTTRDGRPDPRALIDSRSYGLYMRYAYPLERLVASLRKQLFAFRIILVANRPEVL